MAYLSYPVGKSDLHESKMSVCLIFYTVARQSAKLMRENCIVKLQNKIIKIHYVNFIILCWAIWLAIPKHMWPSRCSWTRVKSIQEHLCRLYANAMLIYTKNFHILRIYSPHGL